MTKETLKQLENDLWSAADKLRANSDLKSSEYSTPVLGLIFLKFADNNYRRHEAEIIAEHQKLKGTRREKTLSEIAIEKCGFYLPGHARYDYLLNLPEEEDIAKALKEAMKSIEEYKSELEGVLPPAICSARFTNTSSPSSPEARVKRAANFSPRAPSFASWSR
jgi:type I restriction enzyme M protein